MSVKASQRRSLKHQKDQRVGVKRGAHKPRRLRDHKDSHDGLIAVTTQLCKNCGEQKDRALFVFVRRDGTVSASKFAWCDSCRASVSHARCASCGETKSKEAFYASPSRTVGLSSYCTACTAKSTEASVSKFKTLRQAMSDAELVRTGDVKPGQCIAFVNVGSFTERGFRCSRSAIVGNKCLTHASRDERRIGRALSRVLVGSERFGSHSWREQYERHQQAELANLDDELLKLVAEQAKDSRINQIGKPWQVSLDRRFGDDGDSSLLDFIDHGGRLAFGQRHTPDFSEAVCAVVDRRREIDQWAEEIAA